MRYRLLAAAMATAAFMALGSSTASAQSVGTITATIYWNNGGHFSGSSASRTNRHWEGTIRKSCGGTRYFSVTDVGQWPAYRGALSGDSNAATISMSSQDSSTTTGLPYDSCDGFYHDYSVTGQITATGAPTVYSTNPLVLQRTAIGNSTFCMLPWFGSGGKCTTVGGSGYLRWRPV